MDMKEDPDLTAQLALTLAAGGSNLPWTQTNPIPAPQAHTSMLNASQESHAQHLTEPPPAHAHSVHKPPETFVDKTLLEAAATFLEGKGMGLKSETPSNTGDNQSIPWAIQQQLLQQYGHLMLEKMMSKQGDGVPCPPSATATTDADQLPQSLVTPPSSQAPIGQKADNPASSDPNSIEAQRDVYRRMLNYSMSSTLAQQYYLSQYGYNYMQDRGMFTKPESAHGTHTTTSAMGTQSIHSTEISPQLPSIDSVLLNLSTKKTNGKSNIPATTATAGMQHAATTSMQQQTVPAYGLQALANAAIEADPKAFSEADHHERKDVIKSELEDVTDTDSSNMSPSDSSTSQMMSPNRNTYGHLMDNNQHLSIPTAHSHQHQMPSLYQSKSAALGALPGIQHFSTAVSKPPPINVQMHKPHDQSVQMPLGSVMKPSDLVAAKMRLKVEASEEKEIADRTIQEQIAAHQLNAVQQQVHDLAASALAAGNLDAAALLAKLQANTNMESDLHRLYDHDHNLPSLQQEPMELTSDLSPGKAASRRKSRGRPTSIESLRDPLGRQSSTTSSLGANTSISGDGEDRTFDCEICGKQFSHNDRLRRHRKIHTTDKPYKCDICGKGFKEKCNLKHHRFIHTGEKPYKCDTCGKSFNQRSSLKTHQKVHTGEKPFKCDLCEKPFAQKYLLRQHMKKHIELNLTQPNQP